MPRSASADDGQDARSELKLHADSPTALNTVTAYGSGFIEVNQFRYSQHILVAPDRPVETWDVAGFDALDANRFDQLLALAPELVLLGTGVRQRFPDPLMLQKLTAARVGCESMTTTAACRTYNILMAEGRRVVAALLLED
jgi:uncharacterized protein